MAAESAGSTVYPIPLVRTTVAGFIGRAERGPVDEPVEVRSFAEFHRVFGGHCAASLVSHAVQDYFAHGGSVAIIVRVANRATRGELYCPAGDSSLVLTARYPGSQEALRVSVDYDGLGGNESLFNLVVQRLRGNDSPLIADQELYPAVSIDPAGDRFVVDALSDSRLVRIKGPLPGRRPDATLPERPGAPMRYIGITRPGSDGAELTDYDLIGSTARGTGLFAFDRGPEIDLLCIPPAPGREHGATVFVAAERICAAKRALYILDPPWSWENPAQALAGARALASGSSNVLAYYPRIRPRGERARYQGGLPACGAIAGILAHWDALGVWDTRRESALKNSLMAAVELTPAEVALLGRAGVNAFVRGASGQTRLTGNVVLGSAAGYAHRALQLDQRRLLSFVLRSVESASRFALEHYHGAGTLLALERRVRHFLGALHQRRLLAGKTPAQSFYARLDTSGRRLELRFGIALGGASEFVESVIDVAQGIDPVARPVYGVEADRLFS